MSFIDKFLDSEKTSKAVIKDPKEIFTEAVKMTSGSGQIRHVAYNIFYEVVAFYGITDGIGTSTLVANVALALAETGITICVVDTSMLNPVQDVLLNTSEADEVDDGQEHLDWFDMPYTKKSPLHVSKYKKNISVLSFKSKKKQHGVVDFLSTNDSDTLVDIALTTLHGKFDLILIDCCHELSSVNTACLQQAQQIIQVWNDSPICLANLENFITNSMTLSCPLDKMRNVVFSKCCKDIMGNMDEVLKQYRCTKIAENYISEELYLLNVNGKVLYNVESTNALVQDYTDCIIRVVLHLLNIDIEGKPTGSFTSNDIMEGKVEGTLHKELKDFNDKLEESVAIDRNPMKNKDFDNSINTVQLSKEDIESVDSNDSKESADIEISSEYGGVMSEDDATKEEVEAINREAKENKKKRKGLFGRGKK